MATPHDIVHYKEFRLTKVGAKTVKDSDLVTLKAVFGWAKANLKLPENPAIGITVKAPKRVKERQPGFTPEEAVAILKAARAYTRTNPQENPKTANAKRWLPWLCAYSGARVGEMAQLRKQDISQIDGTWFLRITPEAGTVKNREERKVPIHEHLVNEGFIRFVESSSENYLFLKIEKSSEALRALGTTKNRVRDFVRTIVKDTHR